MAKYRGGRDQDSSDDDKHVEQELERKKKELANLEALIERVEREKAKLGQVKISYSLDKSGSLLSVFNIRDPKEALTKDDVIEWFLNSEINRLTELRSCIIQGPKNGSFEIKVRFLTAIGLKNIDTLQVISVLEKNNMALDDEVFLNLFNEMLAIEGVGQDPFYAPMINFFYHRIDAFKKTIPDFEERLYEAFPALSPEGQHEIRREHDVRVINQQFGLRDVHALSKNIKNSWNAFPKSPRSDNLITYMEEFLEPITSQKDFGDCLGIDEAHLVNKNSTYRVLFFNPDVKNALVNLVAYAAQLSEEFKTDPDNKELENKIDHIRDFVSSILNTKDLTSEKLQEAYLKFERADVNRGTGLYRVYAALRRKSFFDENNKKRFVKSTAGELVYNLMEAVKSQDNDADYPQDNDSEISAGL